MNYIKHIIILKYQKFFVKLESKPIISRTSNATQYNLKGPEELIKNSIFFSSLNFIIFGNLSLLKEKE